MTGRRSVEKRAEVGKNGVSSVGWLESGSFQVSGNVAREASCFGKVCKLRRELTNWVDGAAIDETNRRLTLNLSSPNYDDCPVT